MSTPWEAGENTSGRHSRKPQGPQDELQRDPPTKKPGPALPWVWAAGSGPHPAPIISTGDQGLRLSNAGVEGLEGVHSVCPRSYSQLPAHQGQYAYTSSFNCAPMRSQDVAGV